MSAYAPIEVGVEAYIVRDDKLLMGLRANVKAGSGTWALPGGRIEFMERADKALIREIKEELDIDVTPANLTLLALTDDVQPENNAHHLHITFKVDIGQQEPKRAEPDVCAEWRWVDLSNPPKPIFFAHVKIFDTIATSKAYAPKDGQIIAKKP